ncbi:MAG: PIN domain-containing protein [Myxococcales bacterium]|nr:PIN domain-containing protein [Myxococcales bacterium]
MRAKSAPVRARAADYRQQHGRFTTSVVTVLEITKGLHKAARQDALERFVASLPAIEVMALGQDEALLAGRIYGDLERLGQRIGRADPMIAAIAITADVVLATGNENHYARIRAAGYPLRLDNWRSA